MHSLWVKGEPQHLLGPTVPTLKECLEPCHSGRLWPGSKVGSLGHGWFCTIGTYFQNWTLSGFWHCLYPLFFWGGRGSTPPPDGSWASPCRTEFLVTVCFRQGREVVKTLAPGRGGWPSCPFSASVGWKMEGEGSVGRWLLLPALLCLRELVLGQTGIVICVTIPTWR